MKPVEPLIMEERDIGNIEELLCEAITQDAYLDVLEGVDDVVWEATRHINDIRRYYGER